MVIREIITEYVLRMTISNADVTCVLCELELVIKRVKVSTTPDGKVMDLFFVTDTRFYFLLVLEIQNVTT